MKKEQLIVESLVKRFLVEYLKNNFKIVGSKDSFITKNQNKINIIVSKFETDYFEEKIIPTYSLVNKAIKEFLFYIEVESESSKHKKF